MIELYPLLLAGSGDSSAVGFVFPLLAGPAVFAAVYGLIYRYYRNTDKRHVFEKETEVRVGNLRTDDRKVGENNRQSAARMSGDNAGDHLRRVQRIRVG